jgi:hypothetical protein
VIGHKSYTTVVSASFSQFYLRNLNISKADVVDAETSITEDIDPGDVMFTSPIQDADLQVDVRVFDDRPAELEIGWKDVVEFSFRAGTETLLTGWEEEPGDLRISLLEGESYRLRYAIADMDTARTDHPGPVDPNNPITGIIAIDIWAQPVEPPRILVQETKAGRYWVISHGLQRLGQASHQRRAETTETERITEFADRAFGAYPDLVASTIGDGAKRLLSTAWMLHEIPIAELTGLSRDDEARVTSEAQARITEILLERARLKLNEH